VVAVACDQCGSQFDIWPWRLAKYKKKFCSYVCKGLWSRRTVVTPCADCGKDVAIKASQLKARQSRGQKRFFCNRQCDSNWRSKNPTRLRLLNGAKPHQKLMYGLSCAICSFDRIIEYCHIIPARDGGTIHPDNIVPLCPNHHKLLDRSLLTPAESEMIADRVSVAHASEYARRDDLGPRKGKRKNVGHDNSSEQQDNRVSR
jgi:hypothetical protein